MMRTDRDSIEAELVYDRYLGRGDALDVFQEVLRHHAPTWSQELRVHKGPRDQLAIDIRAPGGLKAAVLTAAGERGPLYGALVAEYGRGHERVFGSAELRGSSHELIVVVAVDEDPFAPIGGAVLLGNRISLQLPRPHVNRQPASVWASVIFEDLCAATSPAWGSVRSIAEYEAKVMSDGPHTAAVGRNFARFLPGLFTVNFLGEAYCELIGRERLLTAPAMRAELVDSGALLVLGQDPAEWDTPPRRDAEQAVLDHIGREHFFLKDRNMAVETRAPDWSR